MRYQDYYKALGVERTATAAEVKKAYRTLSKQYHPDHNDAPSAEARFKEINEAYQVLGDAEKRSQYDSLGAGFSHGQSFRPKPGGGSSGGWNNIQFDFENAFGGRGRGGPVSGGGGGAGFSDFFEMLFGGRPGTAQGFPFGENPYAGSGGQGRKGENSEADISISLEDAYHGTVKKVSLQAEIRSPNGGRRADTRSYDVKIPAGTMDGTRIRLKGQGQPGIGGGPPGDIFLRVKVIPHAKFDVEGHDLKTQVKLAPWELALGAKVSCKTLDGSVKLTIPAGSHSGRTLRLRGKGLKHKNGDRGDLLVVMHVYVPASSTEEEKRLWEELRDLTAFDPRAE